MQLVQKHRNDHQLDSLILRDLYSEQSITITSSPSALAHQFENHLQHSQQDVEQLMDQLQLEQLLQIKNNENQQYVTSNKNIARVLDKIQNEKILLEQRLLQKDQEIARLQNQLKQHDNHHHQNQTQSAVICKSSPSLSSSSNQKSIIGAERINSECISSDEIILFNVNTPQLPHQSGNNDLANKKNFTNEVILIHSSSSQPRQQQGQLQQQGPLTKKEGETQPTIIILPLAYDQKEILVRPLVEKYLIHTLKQNVKLSAFHRVKKNTQHGQKKILLQRIEVRLDEKNTLWLNSYIGAGRYGKVYLIEYNGHQLALKVQTPIDTWDYCLLQHIHEQYASSQGNPFIVKPYALFKDEKSSYFIMDYIDQGTLYDCFVFYINQTRTSLPESLIQLFALRILQAVVSLHQIHVIHNDIKLDNIMLNLCLKNDDLSLLPLVYDTQNIMWQKQSIQLIDFGLAVDLNLLPSSHSSYLAKAGWSPSKKTTDMPAIQNRSTWVPFHLDYFSIANSVHILLHEKPLVNGLPFQSKRYWDKSLWEEFFKVLLQPTCTSIDDGVASLRVLINQFEHSLTYGQHSRAIQKHLLSFITHNHLQKT
ncbi:kinase-like domain-containing protein [Cunninghamella echinulata]|nr:kinase-like domain-containing protein [Cunninghamella echinulata]